jgi:hypothetical protein
MAVLPGPPVEWVRGSWFRSALSVGYFLIGVAFIIFVIRASQTVPPITFSHDGVVIAVVSLILILVSLPLSYYLPNSPWIGLSPEALYVRSPLATRMYRWSGLYRTSPTVFRTEPPGVIFAHLIRLTRHQADRLTRYAATSTVKFTGGSIHE